MLLDVILSIAIIAIIASVLIPASINFISSREKIMDISDSYMMLKNQMEVVGASKYYGTGTYDIVIPKEYKYYIQEDNISDNLTKIKIILYRDGGEKIEVEEIFPSKGLYSN